MQSRPDHARSSTQQFCESTENQALEPWSIFYALKQTSAIPGINHALEYQFATLTQIQPFTLLAIICAIDFQIARCGWLKQRVVTAGGISETTTYDYNSVGQMNVILSVEHMLSL